MPTWLHFPSKNPPKSFKNPIPRGIQKLIDFCFDFWSIWAPFWEPSWSHVGHQDAPKTPQDAPKTPPGGPPDAPKTPRGSQEAPRRPPGGPTRATLMDFGWIFHRFLEDVWSILGWFFIKFWFYLSCLFGKHFYSPYEDSYSFLKPLLGKSSISTA